MVDVDAADFRARRDTVIRDDVVADHEVQDVGQADDAIPVGGCSRRNQHVSRQGMDQDVLGDEYVLERDDLAGRRSSKKPTGPMPHMPTSRTLLRRMNRLRINPPAATGVGVLPVLTVPGTVPEPPLAQGSSVRSIRPPGCRCRCRWRRDR